MRPPFWSFDRNALREEALSRYELDGRLPVLGVFGGSLGAGAVNDAVADMLIGWRGKPLQVVHLAGGSHVEKLSALEPTGPVVWRRMSFEDSMDQFYAAADLVVARAGGAVAELSATGTPSVLVPGRFGSSGHQAGNARFFTDEGAAVTIEEESLDTLGSVVESLIFDSARLGRLASNARRIAKPDAAHTIARAMMGEDE